MKTRLYSYCKYCKLYIYRVKNPIIEDSYSLWMNREIKGVNFFCYHNSTGTMRHDPMSEEEVYLFLVEQLETILS